MRLEESQPGAESTGIARQIETVPTANFLKIQAIDNTQGVQLEHAGDQVAILDLRNAVDQMGEFVVLVLARHFQLAC
jgi:hypothetical protein